MKVIVSHDVDHLYWTDHSTDAFLPKFLARHTISLLRKQIGFSQWKQLISLLSSNRQHRLPELIDFNMRMGAKPTFFVGMANGLGLSYSKERARNCVSWLRDQGMNTGVHGISYQDLGGIKNEREAFMETGHLPNGIRMHYLRRSEHTAGLLKEAGYEYDSTVYQLANPYMDSGLLELPISTMDVYATNVQMKDERSIICAVKDDVDKALALGLKYYTIVFHDVYFDDRFGQLNFWYKTLISHLRDLGLVFIDFDTAVKEITSEES